MSPRFASAGLALLALLAAGGGPVHSVQAQDAASALRAGDYDAAIVLLQRQARQDPRGAAVHRALVRTLAEVGRYADAEEEAKKFQATNPRSPQMFNTLGDVLAARGRNTEAEAAFKKSIAGGASDALAAEVNLAGLRLARRARGSHARLPPAHRCLQPVVFALLRAARGRGPRLLGPGRGRSPALQGRAEGLRRSDRRGSRQRRRARGPTSLFLEKYNQARTRPRRLRRRWTQPVTTPAPSWPWRACSMRTAPPGCWRRWSAA